MRATSARSSVRHPVPARVEGSSRYAAKAYGAGRLHPSFRTVGGRLPRRGCRGCRGQPNAPTSGLWCGPSLGYRLPGRRGRPDDCVHAHHGHRHRADRKRVGGRARAGYRPTAIEGDGLPAPIRQRIFNTSQERNCVPQMAAAVTRVDLVGCRFQDQSCERARQTNSGDPAGVNGKRGNDSPTQRLGSTLDRHHLIAAEPLSHTRRNMIGYDHIDYVRATKPSMSGAPARGQQVLEAGIRGPLTRLQPGRIGRVGFRRGR